MTHSLIGAFQRPSELFYEIALIVIPQQENYQNIPMMPTIDIVKLSKLGIFEIKLQSALTIVSDVKLSIGIHSVIVINNIANFLTDFKGGSSQFA